MCCSIIVSGAARRSVGDLMIEKYSPLQVSALIRSVDPTFYDPTPEQAAIISIASNPFEPAVVIAGAGSGKTETMASRVIYLVANLGSHIYP